MARRRSKSSSRGKRQRQRDRAIRADEQGSFADNLSDSDIATRTANLAVPIESRRGTRNLQIRVRSPKLANTKKATDRLRAARAASAQ